MRERKTQRQSWDLQGMQAAVDAVRPAKIYNADETGLQLNNRPEEILSMKGKRNVMSVTAKERGETVAVLTYVSATVVYMSDSGYITIGLFQKFLEHFATHKPQGRKANLLVLDGHSTHVSDPGILQFAVDNNIIMISIPPQTSHLTANGLAAFNPGAILESAFSPSECFQMTETEAPAESSLRVRYKLIPTRVRSSPKFYSKSTIGRVTVGKPSMEKQNFSMSPPKLQPPELEKLPTCCSPFRGFFQIFQGRMLKYYFHDMYPPRANKAYTITPKGQRTASLRTQVQDTALFASQCLWHNQRALTRTEMQQLLILRDPAAHARKIASLHAEASWTQNPFQSLTQPISERARHIKRTKSMFHFCRLPNSVAEPTENFPPSERKPFVQKACSHSCMLRHDSVAINESYGAEVDCKSDHFIVNRLYLAVTQCRSDVLKKTALSEDEGRGHLLVQGKKKTFSGAICSAKSSSGPTQYCNPPTTTNIEGLVVQIFGNVVGLKKKPVSMEQRRNARAGETGVPRENPPASGFVRHDSHMRKFVLDGSEIRLKSFPIDHKKAIIVTIRRICNPLQITFTVGGLCAGDQQTPCLRPRRHTNVAHSRTFLGRSNRQVPESSSFKLKQREVLSPDDSENEVIMELRRQARVGAADSQRSSAKPRTRIDANVHDDLRLTTRWASAPSSIYPSVGEYNFLRLILMLDLLFSSSVTNCSPYPHNELVLRLKWCDMHRRCGVAPQPEVRLQVFQVNKSCSTTESDTVRYSAVLLGTQNCAQVSVYTKNTYGCPPLHIATAINEIPMDDILRTQLQLPFDQKKNSHMLAVALYLYSSRNIERGWHFCTIVELGNKQGKACHVATAHIELPEVTKGLIKLNHRREEKSDGGNPQTAFRGRKTCRSQMIDRHRSLRHGGQLTRVPGNQCTASSLGRDTASRPHIIVNCMPKPQVIAPGPHRSFGNFTSGPNFESRNYGIFGHCTPRPAPRGSTSGHHQMNYTRGNCIPGPNYDPKTASNRSPAADCSVPACPFPAYAVTVGDAIRRGNNSKYAALSQWLDYPRCCVPKVTVGDAIRHGKECGIFNTSDNNDKLYDFKNTNSSHNEPTKYETDCNESSTEAEETNYLLREETDGRRTLPPEQKHLLLSEVSNLEQCFEK
ncbi:hypothetical protein PR048_003194 [Dryococelus australis]|uniref:DDE-1 domain-containing protein n=1 Tax=Dryococelus australis TaxID=614101 RepID=A0ABQ9IMC4_9NEOP|nr:hypothetical protein PR048_003194 [Dryococelus australis]